MKRKFLSLVLSVVMLLSMLPATSYATEVDPGAPVVESTGSACGHRSSR